MVTTTHNEASEKSEKTDQTSARFRGNDRREQLIGIAIRHFARKGFDGTSLRDIAEDAQITKAALYYHFPNKDSLYETILLHGMAALVDHVRDAMDKESSYENKVRTFMLASGEFIDRDRDSWVAGSNMFWFGEQAKPRVENVRLRDQYGRLLRDALEGAIREGSFRAIDPSMATRMLLAMLNQLPRWHSAKGRLSINQVLTQYLEMAFNGLKA